MCTSSILEQTYQDFELILVDDGSPDNCGKLCDDYAAIDQRIRVIHKKNGGLSDARNAGMAIASGDYLAFIDSDDWVAPAYLESLLRGLEENRADICECGTLWTTGEEEVKEQKSPISEHAVPDDFDPEYSVSGGSDPEHSVSGGSGREYSVSEDPLPGESYGAEEALKALIGDRVFHQHVWNKLYKRSLVQDIPFAVGKLHEDEFWTYQAFGRSKKTVKIPQPLYYYFQRSDSIMGASWNLRRLDALQAKQERQQYLEKHFPALSVTGAENLLSTCIYHGQMARKYLPEQDRKAAVKRINDVRKTVRLSLKDIRPLGFKEGLWLRLSKVSFWGTVRLKNLLRKGF
ncbi:MAG: glycosyltransferase [Lachnospiraceae bacterium]|nr:glycosyltransferase [Lachnospiraceae bacterium]